MALTPEDNAETPERQILRRIGIASAVLGGACALWNLVYLGPLAALSAALGTLTGIGNLWVLATLVTRLLSPDTNKQRAGILLVAKAAGLFALAGLIVSRPWVHGGSFMAGFTAVVLAIGVGGLWGADNKGS